MTTAAAAGDGTGARSIAGAVRRLATRVALPSGGILFALVVAEVALRVLGASYPQLYTWDPQIGIVLRPGAEGWWREEGSAYIRINRHGMRDRDHALEKPSGTLRIAVLGDSYAEALQVPLEKTFWAVMARELGACPAARGRTIEALNFGVSGFGTAQEVLTWRHRAVRFAPDIVLLAVTTGNDVRNNVRTLEDDPLRPYFVLRDGALSLDDSFATHPGALSRQTVRYRAFQWLSGRLRLLQVANRARQLFEAQQRQAQLAREPGGRETRGADAALDTLVYLEPRERNWEEAWEITERLISILKSEVAARGARLHVVTLTSGQQVHPDRRAREAFMAAFGLESLDYPDRRLAHAAEREGIPFLSLTPVLREYAERERTFLHGFGRTLGAGHWNEAGHEEAGRAISRHLCEHLTQETRQ